MRYIKALLFLIIGIVVMLGSLYLLIQACGYLGLWLDNYFGFYIDELTLFGIIALVGILILGTFLIAQDL